jgi:NodT family efflux transporter outer membrane factor (OMF) lipoprotein
MAIAFSSLLVLPSCGIPALRKPEPGPGVPPTYNGSADPENSACIKIEEFFNDPMLTRLIVQAMVGNQELRILANDIQIASNEVLFRSGQYLPFVTVGGNAGLNKFSSFSLEGAAIRDDPFRTGQLFPNPLPNFVMGFNVWWQLDIWRQLRNARDAARLRYFAAIEARNYAVTRIVAEIADNYYGLLALDKRLENLDLIIALQQRSLTFAQFEKDAARGTELAVQRFLAEVRKNQSEKLIVLQEIIQTENRINFLAGRNPQPVERMMGGSIEDFINLSLHALSLGVPPQLLQNRPDIRQAEREIEATGLDVKVARINFFPRLILNSGVGYQAFNPKYLLLTPEALIYNIAGDLVAPLINKRAIQAEFLTANARQLQAIYHFQRVVLDAFTEVINRMTRVENYRRSIEIKKQQVDALVASVTAATQLYQNARTTYMDVLFAQRDLFDARSTLIDTKREQLSAIINTYQALGGGAYLSQLFNPEPTQLPPKKPSGHSFLGGFHGPFH